MRTRILAAAMAAALALALAAPALAGLNQKANALRAQVVKRFGASAAGRDIIRLGVMTRHGVRPAPQAVKRRYVDVLTRTLHPPTSAPTKAPTSAGSSAGGAGGIAACIRAQENSGRYTGTDPSGTYGGAYQFDQATWTAAGGSGSPATAPPAEQDRVFAKWWPGHHGAWPRSGPACGG
jgi:resuscitation-promoting factor RpfB